VSAIVFENPMSVHLQNTGLSEATCKSVGKTLNGGGH
jgi:hypothetical protein